MFSLRVDNETELRQFLIADAEELFALTEKNRTYLRKWLPWIDASQSVNDTLSFIYKSQKQARSNQGIETAISWNGQIVGAIGLNSLDWQSKKCNLTYWIDQDFQSRGLVTRSCKAIICFALQELNMNKIEIRCATGNFKSRGIPERLGFLLEGMSRHSEWINDHYVDQAVYGMLKHEWKLFVNKIQPEKVEAVADEITVDEFEKMEAEKIPA